MKGRGRFQAHFKKDHMKKGIYVLPNLFTTASLFAGIYSVTAAMKGSFLPAAYAIIISLVLDGLDGRMARMTNTTSRFGMEYDSLCDLVAFGVAPAMLAYTWSLSGFGKWGWFAAFFFVACGALRLARFNVQVHVIDKGVFNGLAIPAAAAVIATSVILWQFLGGAGKFQHLGVLFGVSGVALLMVSSIKYYSFKDLNYFLRKPFMSFIAIVLILIVVAAEPQITAFTFSFGYAMSGPIYAAVRHIRQRTTHAEHIEHRLI